jgi:RNA polymerase-binding transcription factor DksA
MKRGIYFMQTKEQLEKRRDEINEELNGVNEDLQTSLDTDMDEQSIETEQEEVNISREANLRKELAEIEDNLLDFED